MWHYRIPNPDPILKCAFCEERPAEHLFYNFQAAPELGLKRNELPLCSECLETIFTLLNREEQRKFRMMIQGGV
jgi:hypothetical protein